jgi:hypothetical protein
MEVNCNSIENGMNRTYNIISKKIPIGSGGVLWEKYRLERSLPVREKKRE